MAAAFNDSSDDLEGSPPPCPRIYYESTTKSKSPENRIQIKHTRVNLTCLSAKYTIQCVLARAKIDLNIHFQMAPDCKEAQKCFLEIPIKGSLMSYQVFIGSERVIATSILSQKEMETILEDEKEDKEESDEKSKESDGFGGGGDGGGRNGNFDDEIPPPGLFRMALENVQPNEKIEVKCLYMEPVIYLRKGYCLKLPLYFEEGSFLDGKKCMDVVEITCQVLKMHPSSKIKVKSRTHEIELMDGDENDEKNESLLMSYQITGIKPHDEMKGMAGDDGSLMTTGRDLQISYLQRSAKITGYALRCTEASSQFLSSSSTHSVPHAPISMSGNTAGSSKTKSPSSGRAETIPSRSNLSSGSSLRSPQYKTLGCFVSPPKTVETAFARSFYILLDRSKNMSTELYNQATQGFFRICNHMHPDDYFNVNVFDEEDEIFKVNRAGMVKASPENISAAKEWIQGIPLRKKRNYFYDPFHRAFEASEKSECMPHLVLITAGSRAIDQIDAERQACSWLAKKAGKTRTRIFAIGVGPKANWYFLRTCAYLTRGAYDWIRSYRDIPHQIDALMKRASTIVMSAVEVKLPPGIDKGDFHVYPKYLRDLYLNEPLDFCIRYKEPPGGGHGRPSFNQITIHGRNYDDKPMVLKLPVFDIDEDSQSDESHLVETIFSEKRLDDLLVNAGLPSNEKLIREASELAIQLQMPCSTATLVQFETTRRDFDSMMRGDRFEETRDNGDDEEGRMDRVRTREQLIGKQLLRKVKKNKGTVITLVAGIGALLGTGVLAGGGDIDCCMACCADEDTCVIL